MELALFAAEENSYILPHAWEEIVWNSIALAIVLWLIISKGGPAIKNMWNARIERIEGDLAGAEAARSRAEGELASVRSSIADADTERSRILDEARSTADSLSQQLIARASTDAADVRTRGQADIEATKAQATGDLSAEVGILAVGAAEAVVTNSLDDQARNELIERYIAKVGSPQ